MIPKGDKYVWLVWALAFLIPWGVLSPHHNERSSCELTRSAMAENATVIKSARTLRLTGKTIGVAC